MRMFAAIAVLAVGMTAAGEAHASGGLSCEADDANVRLMIESGVTRGMGGPAFNFRGEVEIRDKAVAPDLRTTTFDGSHLAQYWFGDDELKMLIYSERSAEREHGFVQITVRTKLDDEGSTSGTYEIATFDVAGTGSGDAKESKAEGPISCFVE